MSKPMLGLRSIILRQYLLGLGLSVTSTLLLFGCIPRPQAAQVLSDALGSCKNWAAGTTYQEGERVLFNGKAYVAVHENPGYDPTISTWFWDESTCVTAGATQSNPDGTAANQNPNQNPNQDPTQNPIPNKPQNPSLPNTFGVSIASLKVANAAGAKPAKGEKVVLSLTLKNSGSVSGTVKITPLLTSRRFTDYTNVSLPTQVVNVNGGETKTHSISVEPYFQDVKNKKEYALNRGNYSLAFDLEVDGAPKKTVNDLAGRDFEVTKSNAVFTAVYWDQSYLNKMNYTGGIEKYMNETFQRKGEILKPSQKDGSTGEFVAFQNGFDDMMKIKTMFKIFDGFKLGATNDGVGILKQVEAYGKTRLGLTKDFQGTGCDRLTHEDNHGYDMEIGVSHEGFGGIAWVCGNTQASGVFDGDPSVGRSQMVLIHETGHNFGAPHCDPIQGFIMCSGEKHDHYRNGGSFVWHQNSIDAMKKSEPAQIQNQTYSFLGETAPKAQTMAVCTEEH